MTIYAGIDPSITCTGVCAVEMIDEDNLKFEFVDKKTLAVGKLKVRGFEKRAGIADAFEYMFENFPEYKECAFFIFESYSYGSQGHLAELGELNGMIKRFLQVNDKPFDTISPMEVKKLVGGHGRATKVEVRDGLRKFLVNFDSINWENFDESDAAAVAVAYGIKMAPKPTEEEKQNESEENS